MDGLGLFDSYELRIFTRSHPNCLLIGTDAMVDEAMAGLTPFFRGAPVWLAGRPLDLPSAPAGTFVVRNIGDFSAAQQAEFSDWMERAPGRVQVISTTRWPILPAVEANTFLASLYYRLNTLTISLVSQGPRVVPRPGLRSDARNLTE